jgi:hypothetical protein
MIISAETGLVITIATGLPMPDWQSGFPHRFFLVNLPIYAPDPSNYQEQKSKTSNEWLF